MNVALKPNPGCDFGPRYRNQGEEGHQVQNEKCTVDIALFALVNVDGHYGGMPWPTDLDRFGCYPTLVDGQKWEASISKFGPVPPLPKCIPLNAKACIQNQAWKKTSATNPRQTQQKTGSLCPNEVPRPWTMSSTKNATATKVVQTAMPTLEDLGTAGAHLWLKAVLSLEGGCTKANVHMTWKHDGALIWWQIVQSSARPWEDLSRFQDRSKMPRELGGEVPVKNLCVGVTAAPCWSKSKLQLATASFRETDSEPRKHPSSK